MSAGWIGVDLDGTLAEYGKFQGHGHIGAPIPAMLDRVKRWLAEGRDVRIFTARVSGPPVEAEAARAVICKWVVEHVGLAMTITCVKDYSMRDLWDDRAVAVEKNTGRARAFQSIDADVVDPRGAA